MTLALPVPGQIWSDRHPRARDKRFVRVLSVIGEHAICEAWTVVAGYHKQQRRTKIDLDRFDGTDHGYKLVETR